MKFIALKNICSIFGLAIALFFVTATAAHAASYYFNNAVNTDPTEMGNYWNDFDATDPAGLVPDTSVDEVSVLLGATYNGNAVFRGLAGNYGTVTGDATFYDNATIGIGGTVEGDVVLYEENTNIDNGVVLGTRTRIYTVAISTQVDMSDGDWIAIADGVEVDISNVQDSRTTIYQTINGGEFVYDTSRYYFDNTINTSPTSLGNYWHNNRLTFQATGLPDASVDDITITYGATYAGDAIFNGSAANQGTVTGDAVFNDGSQNGENQDAVIMGNAVFHDYSTNNAIVQGNAEFYEDSVGGGVIEGDAVFRDNSSMSAQVGGDAIFYDDLGTVNGTINGTKTRYYTQDSSPNRDFTDWIVVADGAVVDITESTINGSTVLTTMNGGSFTFTPFVYAGRFNKLLTIKYNVTLNASSVPEPEDFEVIVNDIPVTASEVSLSGKDIFLEFTTGFSVNDVVTVNYTPGTHPLKYGDILLASFTDLPTAHGILVGRVPFDLMVIGTKIYLTNQTDGTVSVIDSLTDTVNTTIQVGAIPNYSYYGIIGNKIYVTNSGTEDVSVIDTVTDTVTATIPAGAFTLYPTIVGTKLYSMDRDENTVTVIDTTTDTVITTIPVANHPYHAHQVGTKLYVTSHLLNPGAGVVEDETVSVIDTTTDTLLTTINVGGDPIYSANVGTKLYVTGWNISGTNYISVIDTVTDTVTDTITVGNVGVTTGTEFIRAYGNYVYVVGYTPSGNGVVYRIDTTTDTIVQTIPIGDTPFYANIFGDKLYVVNRLSNSVSVIDLDTNTVVDTVAVGGVPYDVRVVGGKLYVNNSESNSVSVVALDDFASNRPSLTSFSTTTASGVYTAGASIPITAHFAQQVALGSTMTVTMSTGATVL